MKTTMMILVLMLSYAAQAQTSIFNGFPTDANTSKRIKGTKAEVFVDGVLQETKEVKGKKVMVQHNGKGAVIIRISKEGYDDFYFAMDYSAAPTDDRIAHDIPVKMTARNSGNGDDTLAYDWKYNPSEEIKMECTAVTQAELKTRLKK